MKGRWSGGLIPNGKQFGGGGVKECICYWVAAVFRNEVGGQDDHDLDDCGLIEW